MESGPESAMLPRHRPADTTDKRLLRGAKTRQTVLRQAADIASLDGLEGVSFGRLATETGLSKAGIQTLFKTKEALQLATIDYARELFVDHVVQPARPQPHGVARLRALVDSWLAYVETPVLTGGCFWVACAAEQDSRPGPVHDALFDAKRAWLRTLERELREAVDEGEIADVDAAFAAFQIDAVLSATNTALRIGEKSAAGRARSIVASLLVTP
ncbi:TetR/AcrR family transcriptional regulator [Nocardia sp. NPDC049149]|uniref:TetR/AcrR family transcriptional regulator n=1 Tax=Nocardia sp. NPDC049149 TaxID=3364315 RepID=UPI0037204E8A